LSAQVRTDLAHYLGVHESVLREPGAADVRLHQGKSAAGPLPPVDQHQGDERRSTPHECVAVREINARCSVPPTAAAPDQHETIATWTMPEPMLRHELNVRPDAALLMRIEGDSMAPLLCSGDHVLVDTDQRQPVPPGLFVIQDGTGLVAKRIEHVPNSEPSKIVITSVNEIYQSYTCNQNEVIVIGRVIWMGRHL
jgi:hypothetical protein